MSYLHPGYAESFRELGQPIRLERAGGWLLKRRIGEGPYFDLSMAPPHLACRELAEVSGDLESLDVERVASVMLVTDPLYVGSVREALREFDFVKEFKTHYVASLDRAWRDFARKSCRRYARRANQELEIRRLIEPPVHEEAFWELHRELLEYHRVSDNRRFSRETVAAHLRLPGVTLFEAREASGRALGMATFFEVDDRVYSHLLGVSEKGRRAFAIYGLYGAALDHYQNRASWLDFGGNAGIRDDLEDGLGRFKRGWANETRTSYLCGRILNHRLYTNLCTATGQSGNAYFPAYRASEAR